MEARICGFKRGRGTIDTKHCVVESSLAELEQIIGKRVFWRSAKGRTIKGRVLKRHGRKAYLCRFERAIPADAVGEKIGIGRPMPEKAAKVLVEEKPEKVPAKPKTAKTKKEILKKKAKEKPKKAAKAPAKKASPAKKKEKAAKTKTSKKASAKKKAPKKKK